MEQQKLSIRFYNDREVRAAWSEEGSKWLFSVLDVIGSYLCIVKQVNKQNDEYKFHTKELPNG